MGVVVNWIDCLSEFLKFIHREFLYLFHVLRFSEHIPADEPSFAPMYGFTVMEIAVLLPKASHGCWKAFLHLFLGEDSAMVFLGYLSAYVLVDFHLLFIAGQKGADHIVGCPFGRFLDFRLKALGHYGFHIGRGKRPG